MGYFDDLSFFSGGISPDCDAVVDRPMPEFYALNYLSEGAIHFGMNGGPMSVIRAPAVYWTWRENTYQYWKVEGTTWGHAWVAFYECERMRRMLETGLFRKLKRPWIALQNTTRFEEEFHRLVLLVRAGDPDTQADRVLLLESLLHQIEWNLDHHQILEKVSPHHYQNILKVAATIRGEPFVEYHLETLASEISISYSSFRRLFKLVLGESPHDYILSRRMLHAAREIQKGEESIKRISEKLGYESLAYFSRLFTKKIGKSPRHYRNSMPL